MSDCDVCIGTDDYEPVDEYESEIATAESEETCTECREKIAAGIKYEHVTYEFHGEANVERTCLSCVEIRDVFRCGEGFCHGDLWESMRDHAFPDLTTASKCFTKLSAAAKQRVLDKWNEWKFEGAE